MARDVVKQVLAAAKQRRSITLTREETAVLANVLVSAYERIVRAERKRRWWRR